MEYRAVRWLTRICKARIIFNSASWSTSGGLDGWPCDGGGGCWRYATLDERLTETNGRLTPQDAAYLLASVAQESTQWSIVYGFSTGDVHVVVGREYNTVHTLHMDLANGHSQ